LKYSASALAKRPCGKNDICGGEVEKRGREKKEEIVGVDDWTSRKRGKGKE
jgi:hypothetical protein